MIKYEKKTLFIGLSYGVLLLSICVGLVRHTEIGHAGRTILFYTGLLSTVISVFRWYFAYDKKHENTGRQSDRVPSFTDDPHINSLVVNVYKWFLILPIMGILTLLSKS